MSTVELKCSFWTFFVKSIKAEKKISVHTTMICKKNISKMGNLDKRQCFFLFFSVFVN